MLALLMSQARPGQSVFIDDRKENVAAARALGMCAIRYMGAGQLVGELAAVGIAIEEEGDP